MITSTVTFSCKYFDKRSFVDSDGNEVSSLPAGTVIAPGTSIGYIQKETPMTSPWYQELSLLDLVERVGYVARGEYSAARTSVVYKHKHERIFFCDDITYVWDSKFRDMIVTNDYYGQVIDMCSVSEYPCSYRYEHALNFIQRQVLRDLPYYA